MTPPRSSTTTLTRDDFDRIERLRTGFLDDARGDAALSDYWRDDADLRAYDRVLAARIGWKWDAALAECRDRGMVRTDTATVLDYGCGSGVAARRYVAAFGAGSVLCHDRSARAMAFAVQQLRAELPTVAARTQHSLGTLQPDVLLVSHVLAELDARGEAELLALIARSKTVVLVEPGAHRTARRLAVLRGKLLATHRIVAPCPHAGACPSLHNGNDWCHFFAEPPPHVFTEAFWAHASRELHIDLRALPYSFLALQREASTVAPPENRVLGRPEISPHTARVQVCTEPGLRMADVTKRHDAALWKRLKKDPATVRSVPPTTLRG